LNSLKKLKLILKLPPFPFLKARDENPGMTLPIKKIISTEIFVDGRAELFYTNRETELSGKTEKGKMLPPRPTRGGNEKP